MRIDELVAQMVPRRYTRKQAGVLIGRSADQIERWEKQGLFTRTAPREQFGKTSVIVYSDEDIAVMAKLVGRPRGPYKKRK